jgi:hypothetical protein
VRSSVKTGDWVGGSAAREASKATLAWLIASDVAGLTSGWRWRTRIRQAPWKAQARPRDRARTSDSYREWTAPGLRPSPLPADVRQTVFPVREDYQTAPARRPVGPAKRCSHSLNLHHKMV